MTNNNKFITDPNISMETPHKYTVFLSILWVSILISGFFTSIKTFEIYGVVFFAATIAYPFTYIFNDIMTEVYGYKVSRKIVWSGFFGVLVATIIAWLYTYIPGSSEWTLDQDRAFNTIFRISPFIAILGIISFASGEIANSIIISKLKVKMNGKYESFRCITSTFVGQLIDNTIFAVGLYLILDIISGNVAISVIVTTVIFCTLWEIIAYPIFTKHIIRFVKKKEGIDTYDRGIKYRII